MVPAYDDPVLWEGHSSMVTELKEQLANKPAAIICSVGGGGLLGGIITGCEKEGWDDGGFTVECQTRLDMSCTSSHHRHGNVGKQLILFFHGLEQPLETRSSGRHEHYS